MTASQMPGQTLQPIPANPGPVGDDELTLLQKCVENAYNIADGLGQAGVHADPHDDAYALLEKLTKNLYAIQ